MVALWDPHLPFPLDPMAVRGHVGVEAREVEEAVEVAAVAAVAAAAVAVAVALPAAAAVEVAARTGRQTGGAGLLVFVVMRSGWMEA